VRAAPAPKIERAPRWHPSPVFWRVLHSQGYYLRNPSTAIVFHRRGKMHGNAVASHRKMRTPARIIR